MLFLDEMCEFPAAVLDALRQPMEEGVVRVCRAAGRVTFPARFLLVARHEPVPVRGGRPAGVVPVRRWPRASATAGGCRGPCSTGSTCGWW